MLFQWMVGSSSGAAAAAGLLQQLNTCAAAAQLVEHSTVRVSLSKFELHLSLLWVVAESVANLVCWIWRAAAPRTGSRSAAKQSEGMIFAVWMHMVWRITFCVHCNQLNVRFAGCCTLEHGFFNIC